MEGFRWEVVWGDAAVSVICRSALSQIHLQLNFRIVCVSMAEEKLHYYLFSLYVIPTRAVGQPAKV